MPNATSLYQFSVQADGGSASNFVHVAPGQGCYALECRVGPPLRDVYRFHPVGVQGSVTIRDEVRGRIIYLKILLVDTLALAWAYAHLCFDDWRASPVTITDIGGKTWTKCNMVEGKILDISADGISDKGYVELVFEASFTKDQDF